MLKSAHITVMTQAVLKAARGLTRDFGEVGDLQISKKGAAGFVTSADLRAEKTLHYELSKARPAYGFLMEEGGEVKGSDASHRWVVDPLDGTHNFIHALPYFCISVALEKDGEVIAAVTYDPLQNELFVAEKGQGAYVNNRRLQVARREKPEEMMAATGSPRPGRPEYARMLSLLDAAGSAHLSVRFYGAAALDLAYVAAGRYDAFWHPELRWWDMAAGMLLVQEAGGTITTLEGGPCNREGGVLAGSQQGHPLLLKHFKALEQAKAS